MGKRWAKGLTAATDARVARNAAAHRGRTYVRHLSPEQDTRYRGHTPRTLPLEWSETMAYIVGLMATDGCLIGDGRHLSFDSGDVDLVQTFLTCVGRSLRFRTVQTKAGGVAYKAAFSDVRFYRWLLGIGLHPRKSLTIGAIDAPDSFAGPLARGLFEGDGHISNFTHAPTKRTYPKYLYERLWVFFNSASRPHLEWLRELLARTLGVTGLIEMRKPREGRHDFFHLKYGNHDSIRLLRAMYPNPNVPKLERKWKIWNDYAMRHSLN